MSDSSTRRTVITVIGCLQILAWGCSFYLLGVLAIPIAADTQWSLATVVAGVSVALVAAGIVSPVVGRAIQRHGGRFVLASSSIFLAAGLALLGFAPSPPVYFLAWSVIGLGMGAGLYDPAFSTLGHLYGQSARRMITAVTLFGGFASTVSWPVSTILLEQLGWRGTCWTYAALNLFLGAPLYLTFIPRPAHADKTKKESHLESALSHLLQNRQRVAFILLGAILTLGAAILSLVSMHLLTLLQARGLELAAAVSLGALIGPSQVAARVIEITAGKRLHPVWTMFGGALFVAIGTALLWSDWSISAVALIAYGAGNGISSIVRGTVPLVLFGSANYAVLMGRIGLPMLLAMALSPAIGAVLVEFGGAWLTLGVVAWTAVFNVVLVLVLAWWCRHQLG